MTFREINATIEALKDSIVQLSREDTIPPTDELAKQLSRDAPDWDLIGHNDGWIRFFPGRPVCELIPDRANAPAGCALGVMDSNARKYFQRYYSVDLLLWIADCVADYRKNEVLSFYEDETVISYYVERQWNALRYEEPERRSLEAITGLCRVFSDQRFARRRTPALDEELRSSCAEFLALWKIPSPD